MTGKTDWEFWLTGNPVELRALTSILGTRYFNIYGGVDHQNDCMNDDFRMNTVFTSEIADVEAAWQIGYELVSLYNGASVIFDAEHLKFGIEGVYKDDIKCDYFPKCPAMALLGKPNLAIHSIEENLNNAKANKRLWLLHQATERKEVYVILKYLDMELSYTNYYRVMETVLGFAKKQGITLDFSQTEKESFTSTANNYALSGFDSRHGFSEAVNINKKKYLSIEQSWGFVMRLVTDYLSKSLRVKIV